MCTFKLCPLLLLALVQDANAGQQTAQAQTQAARTAGQLVNPAPLGKAAQKTLLSFGDDMEVEDAVGHDFSLANSTHRKSGHAVH